MSKEYTPPDPRYCGGAVWEGPNYMACVIGLAGGPRSQMMLLSGPLTPGGVYSEEDGTWLYSPEELPKRLVKWTYLGQFRDLYYIGCHPRDIAK